MVIPLAESSGGQRHTHTHTHTHTYNEAATTTTTALLKTLGMAIAFSTRRFNGCQNSNGKRQSSNQEHASTPHVTHENKLLIKNGADESAMKTSKKTATMFCSPVATHIALSQLTISEMDKIHANPLEEAICQQQMEKTTEQEQNEES